MTLIQVPIMETRDSRITTKKTDKLLWSTGAQILSWNKWNLGSIILKQFNLTPLGIMHEEQNGPDTDIAFQRILDHHIERLEKHCNLTLEAEDSNK